MTRQQGMTWSVRLSAVLMLGGALLPSRASAQGCILARLSSPLLGGAGGPYLGRNEWQVSATYRILSADTHFAGIKEVLQRELKHNNVINKQQILDIGITRELTRRTNLSVGIPILTDGSWSVPVPVEPPGPRQTQRASGLGDVSLTVRYWVLEPERHPNGNLELGVGVKAPTGDANAKHRFPDATGRVFSQMPVDQSIQPGDGGWGIDLDAQGFKQVGTATLFASATYLVNPRNKNGTESSVLFLCGGTIPPNLQRFKYNSVPDQYLARAGVSVPVPHVKGLSFSLAARIEGVPVRDLVGGSDGFRRPGYSIFLEPGITYSTGPHSLSLSAPVATQRNIQKLDGTNYRPDGTLADYFFLLGYSYRFGGSHKSAKAHGGMTPANATNKTTPAGEQLYDEKADGEQQVREALGAARAGGKRVFLHFGANWCGPCHELHALLTKDPALAAAIERGYVIANIDLNEEHNAKLRARYARRGQETIPFVVILDAQGKRLDAPAMETLATAKEGGSFDATKVRALLDRWMPVGRGH